MASAVPNAIRPWSASPRVGVDRSDRAAGTTDRRPSRASGPATTSRTRTVTLSWPPFSTASSTSRSAVSWTDPAASTSASLPSSSSLNSPSLHNRYRSPSAGSSSQLSITGSASMPRARVRMLRCGCRAASSAVSSPARIRSATRLWSSLTWTSSPAAKRYTRLSPMLATARTSSPEAELATARAHRVVPIPERSGLVTVISRMVRLADRTADTRPARSRRSNMLSMAATASAEATSPPRWPPIPSATTYRPSTRPTESWLEARIRPVWLAVPASNRTERPRSIRPEAITASAAEKPQPRTRGMKGRREARHPRCADTTGHPVGGPGGAHADRASLRRLPLAFLTLHARVAELADAQDSGSCVRKDVRVQVPPRAPLLGVPAAASSPGPPALRSWIRTPDPAVPPHPVVVRSPPAPPAAPSPRPRSVAP